MTTKLKRRMTVIVCASVVIIAVCALYVRTHPLVFNESFLDHAHCIVGTGLSMLTYAEDHGGRFPFDTNGYGDALLLMTNYMANFWAGFTGPGYDGRVFAEAAQTGRHIPEQACGRVYVQGLSKTDNPQIALLFDKLATPGGDHCHLFRRMFAPLVREVWTIGDGRKVIPDSEWPAYSRHQVGLLLAAGVPKEKAERYYRLASEK
jgi:hypothetical protein